MIEICTRCGLRRADQVIEATADPGVIEVVCPECGHRRPWKRLPLLLVGGPSGTGKTTVVSRLIGTLGRVVLLEADLLWHGRYADDPVPFFRQWLRVCRNIQQAGRPVALFGAGFVVPENIEALPERPYFSRVHRLGLTCEDELIAERLGERPAWRNSMPTLPAHQEFNRWLRRSAASLDIALIDTGGLSVDETVERVRRWIDAALDAEEATR